MVRKRSRKYANDDNDSDSDVEFDPEAHSKPAPKKYSLRERKSTTSFLVDNNFDYFLEEEERCSSDDDFKIEEDFDATRPFFEPDPNVDPQNAEGLIDFEDIIRADIVVNKNKIDYDNLIQKTEIKLNPPKRRGRKPKNKIEDVKLENNESNDLVCEPELENLSEMQNETDEKHEQNLLSDETVSVDPEKMLDAKSVNIEELHNECTSSVEIHNENTSDVELHNESTSNVDPTKLEASLDMVKENVEDDDVIVLGELKQDVIVLDD